MNLYDVTKNRESLRKKTVEVLVGYVVENLTKLYHHEAGRVLETAVQMLDDVQFTQLATICVNHQDDPMVQEILGSVILKLVARMGLDVSEQEYVCGCKQFLLLICAEDLRRKGHLHYLWPSDIFSTPMVDFLKIATVTESGKQIQQKQLLQMFQPRTTQ